MNRDLPEYLQAMWDEAEAHPGTPVDVGRTVVCDTCYIDYTDRPDSGGLIWKAFGSMACCPACEPDHLRRMKELDEEYLILARCPAEKSFADFVREYRAPMGHAIRITRG
jgi:hypothetical protein